MGYKSEVTDSTIRAAEEIERTRQALIRGEANPKTLAYARFLNAIENDATISHGSFKEFRSNNSEIVRDWPFLAPLIEAP